MDATEAIGATISMTTRYVRTNERLRTTLGSVHGAVTGLREIIEIDPELGPHVTTALAGLENVIAGMEEVGNAIDRQFDEQRQRLMQETHWAVNREHTT